MFDRCNTALPVDAPIAVGPLVIGPNDIYPISTFLYRLALKLCSKLFSGISHRNPDTSGLRDQVAAPGESSSDLP